MSLKEEDRSYAARVARAQGMGLQRQNAETIIDEKDVQERKEEKRRVAKEKALRRRKPTGRYFLNRETTGRGSKTKRRRKSRKTKRRRKSRKQTGGMMRVLSRQDTERISPGARRVEHRRERPQGWRARTNYSGLGEKNGWVAYDHHDIYDGSWRGLVPTDEACCSTCRKTLCDTLTCKRNAIKKCYRCDYNPDTNSWHANNDSRQCMTNDEKYNAIFPSARGSRKKHKKKSRGKSGKKREKSGKKRGKSRKQTGGMRRALSREDTEPIYPGARRTPGAQRRRRGRQMWQMYWPDGTTEVLDQNQIMGNTRNRNYIPIRELREAAEPAMGEKNGWFTDYDGRPRPCCTSCSPGICDTLMCKRNPEKKCYACDFDRHKNRLVPFYELGKKTCVTNDDRYAYGSRKRRKKRNTKKTRGSTQHKVKASTMRKHSKKHSKRHINHMKKMMKKGYSFKKAHRSAMRKVGK